MRNWKGCSWALCFLFLLLRPVESNTLPEQQIDQPTNKPALEPIFSRDVSPAIRNPVPVEALQTTTTPQPPTTTSAATTTTEAPRTTEAPLKTTTNRYYRGSRIELKRPAAAVGVTKNATSTAINSNPTPRSEPKIQMKRPAELRPAMGLKESLIQITDQLRQRQAIRSEAVKTEVQIAKKPAAAKSNQDNEEIIIYETSGHDGVALPLTMEDIEREMAQVEFQLQESTPKEGISTWILLSGTGTTPQPIVKGPSYAVETEKMLDSDKKMDKIMKVKDDKESPVLLPKRRPSTTPAPVVKAKPKKTTPKTTTTTTTSTTEAPTTEEEAPIVEAVTPKLRLKVKPESRVNTKRPRRPTTTTTTTTETPQTTTEEEVTEEPAKSEENSTFLILEAKESEFDLPADRSPTSGKKKTPVQKQKKNKKKPDVKNKKKPLEDMLEEFIGGVDKPAKTPNKNKEKPISTQIMNYLSREVMPTVGVGIVGLVAAAGIATYFLGNTFTPLRRNDRTDEIYYNNNEEYAGPDGQYEEEWFSKVIAGSPTYRNNLRQAYKPGQVNGPAPTVSVQQQNYAVHKYPQYSKYATRPAPSQGPQYSGINPNHRNYNVRQQFSQQNYRINAGPNPMPTGPNPAELVRKHSMAMPHNYHHHPASPQQSAPQAAVNDQETQGYFSEASKRHSFSSGPSEILAETPQEAPSADASTMIEDNNFLKRTSQSQQFVVGSVYPEALSAKDPSAVPQAESVPEHGPRRRRRRGAGHQLVKKTKKLDDNELDNENELPIEELEQIANVQVGPANTEKVETSGQQEHVTSSSAVSTTQVVEDGKVESTTATAGVTYYETVSINSNNSTFGDFIKRMVQLKLKLGISFLRGMADGVAKYLHQVEERLYRPAAFGRR